MSAFLKKYFWVVHLVAIAALAWAVASAISAATASALFVVPKPPATSPDEGEVTVAALAGRVAADEDAAAMLEARKVFDLKDHEDEGGGEADEEPEEPAEPTAGDGELEESELPIDLMGTLVSPDPSTSMATLSIEGENKLAWIGSEFLDGKATVMAIEPRHIIVREGADLKVVKLWSDKSAQAGAQTAPGRFTPGARPTTSPVRPRPTAPTVSSSRTDYSEGVKKTGAYDYEIDRGMIDEQLKDLSALGTQARVVPNYRNGKYEGFKLVGVRPGSLYRAIGIRSGDVIRSVNGQAIDSPNKALELFEQFKTSSNIKVEIERRGRPQDLQYSIK